MGIELGYQVPNQPAINENQWQVTVGENGHINMQTDGEISIVRAPGLQASLYAIWKFMEPTEQCHRALSEAGAQFAAVAGSLLTEGGVISKDGGLVVVGPEGMKIVNAMPEESFKQGMAALRLSEVRKKYTYFTTQELELFEDVGFRVTMRLLQPGVIRDIWFNPAARNSTAMLGYALSGRRSLLESSLLGEAIKTLGDHFKVILSSIVGHSLDTVKLPGAAIARQLVIDKIRIDHPNHIWR